MNRRHLAVAILGVTWVLIVPGSSAASDDDPFGAGGSTRPDAFRVELDLLVEAAGSGTTAGSDADGQPIEVVRAPACVAAHHQMARDPVCIGNDPIVEFCVDGSQARDPVWVRRQEPDGTWGPWAAVTWYTCPGDADLLAAIEREWTQLRPAPSTIELQPNTGWVIANVPTVAMADDAPRLHATTLLGAGVEIRATPSGYVWTWGDGERTTTTDPGRPHPHATLTHTYAHASGDATVALTTTWTGEYRVNGGPWIDFSSTIESDSAPVPLTVHDPRSGLVDCDLAGNCRLTAQR